MSKKYNILVFIMRAQPLHLGHKKIIDKALSLADKVIILVGSSNVARSLRNPFTFEERKSMIYSIYPAHSSIIVEPLNDMTYQDEQWIEQVQAKVLANIEGNHEHLTIHGLKDVNIGLIGCDKDHSSYYLKLFPTWKSEQVEYLDPLNSTSIRKLYFTNSIHNWFTNVGMFTSAREEYVPGEIVPFLEKFKKTDTYRYLVEEYDFTENYKKSIQQYPRIEHTVDAVVTQSGHVLLIKRRASPGKGQWALPGGFIKPEEKLEEAMLRELREETKIKVPLPVLKGNIVKTKTYDDPHRSDRARIITQAYHIKLPDQTELPKVKGSDDAEKAKWIPLAEIDPTKLFEDHIMILKDML